MALTLKAWFEGTFSDAMTTAEVEKKLLLVFLEGDDDTSKTCLAILQEITEKLKQHAILLRITSESESGQTFASMYAVPVIPSTVILQDGGAAHVIGGEVNGADLLVELEKLTGKETIDVEVKPQSTLSFDERMKLLEAKREEVKMKKSKEDEERELEFERNRRKTGQEITKLRKMREEQEMKEAMDERKRDAQLEKDARARVLAQIAADREDRKRRLENKPVVEELKRKEPVSMPKVDSDSTRIQFRMPDGRTVTEVFKSKDPLQQAVDFVDKQNIGYGKFSLTQTFPRKVFGEVELQKSFYDLSLAPASVLIVVPDRSTRVPVI